MTGKNKVKHVVDAAIELCKIYNTPKVLEICQFNKELYLNHQFRK
jgi:hypothetical protein